MKNVFKFLGIIALVAVIGFGVVSCGGGDDDNDNNNNNNNNNNNGGSADTALNGTWSGADGDLTFNNGNFEMSGFMKGTYTTTGSNISVTVTHVNGDEMGLESKWYTKAELKAAAGDFIDDDDLDELFFSSTGTYSISGSTLTITMDGDTMTLTKNGGSTNPGGSAITYTATANNSTNTTAITLTFSAAVTGLTATDITVTNGTGSAAKGTLTGSGTSWSLGITVNIAGNITVSINKSGIESGNKTVAIAKPASVWTAVDIGTLFDTSSGSKAINRIAYGNGKFVAGGNNGKIAYSSDGIAWTAVEDSKFSTDDRIYGIVYGGAEGQEKFIAVSITVVNNRVTGNKIATSTDGTTWSLVSTAADVFNNSSNIRIAYCGGKFVVHGGTMATSDDGMTWTGVSFNIFGNNGDINAIAYANGTFVAGGGSRGDQCIATSTDGTTWTLSDTTNFGTTDNTVYAITYGNGKFFIGTRYASYIYSSTDGKGWTYCSTNNLDAVRAIAYGNSKFFAVGDKGKIATSDDGSTWTRVTQSVFGDSDTISTIVYGNGKFVAIGSGKIAYLSDN